MTSPGYKVIISSATVVAVAVFALWMLSPSSYQVEERVPGLDNRPPQKPISDSVIIGEFFESLSQAETGIDINGNWPRFRGEQFDNIATTTEPLAEKWDSSGPPVIWKNTLGEGYSGAAVRNGKVYVLDYNEKRKADMLRCFSLASGEELWRRWYTVVMKRNHGYARTIPAVTDKYVVTIGPRSHVMCVSPADGKLLWTINMEREFGIKGKQNGKITPEFYTGQCPLIDNDIAVIAPGGKAIMAGIDCATGKILWQAPNPDSLMMSHTSIMPMTIHGKRMYVYCAIGGVCAVSAEGNDRGSILWSTRDWNPSLAIASPVYLGNGEIAVFGSYGAGAAKISVSADGNRFTAKVIEKHKANEGMSSEQHTPILNGNYLWVVLPENAGVLKRQLACFEKSNLKTPVWSSGKDLRFGRGMGPFILAGDKMFLLDDEGHLFLFRINGPNAELIADHKVMEAIEAWGPMALVGKFLIMRDSHNMLCIDIGKQN